MAKYNGVDSIKNALISELEKGTLDAEKARKSGDNALAEKLDKLNQQRRKMLRIDKKVPIVHKTAEPLREVTSKPNERLSLTTPQNYEKEFNRLKTCAEMAEQRMQEAIDALQKGDVDRFKGLSESAKNLEDALFSKRENERNIDNSKSQVLRMQLRAKIVNNRMNLAEDYQAKGNTTVYNVLMNSVDRINKITLKEGIMPSGAKNIAPNRKNELNLVKRNSRDGR